MERHERIIELCMVYNPTYYLHCPRTQLLTMERHERLAELCVVNLKRQQHHDKSKVGACLSCLLDSLDGGYFDGGIFDCFSAASIGQQRGIRV